MITRATKKYFWRFASTKELLAVSSECRLTAAMIDSSSKSETQSDDSNTEEYLDELKQFKIGIYDIF